MDIEKEHIRQAISEFNAFSAGEKTIDFKELYETALFFLVAYEELEKHLQENFTPRSMDTAPTDGTYIMLRTQDDDWVEGRWCAETDDFYKSNKRFAAVYDPENCKGTWVANYGDSDGDRRMYCGMTPNAWMPKLPKLRGEVDGH